ncbi:MAG: MlaD family protein [Isosphaeraceae bacterium]|nr:MlaD family protein [Isosphaeraceae bacterium]
MNERVMQFRIGMFVIVTGLVLIMMIIWFGESPALFRDHVFLRAHYPEAPGVSVGIPVRKSGIRIGEVSAIEFDNREGQTDGVIVTMAIERKIQLKKGSTPRISRALIGDVSIDMTPGTSTELLELGGTAESAVLIEGQISPDPAKALAAATEAFQKVGTTLEAIETAADGVSGLAKKADSLDAFLETWRETGKSMSSVSKRIDDVIVANQDAIKPAVADIRDVARKLNETLDEQTVASARQAIDRLATASAKLDQALIDLQPLAADLGAPVNVAAKTNFGQVLMRVNRIAADVGVVTRNFVDASGKMNPNGTIQRLVTDPQLFDNFNKVAAGAADLISTLRPAAASLRVFAEKVARDPAAITRGALQR